MSISNVPKGAASESAYVVFITCPYCFQRTVAKHVHPYEAIVETKMCVHENCQMAYSLQFRPVSGAAIASRYPVPHDHEIEP